MYRNFTISGRINALSEDEALDLLGTILDEYDGIDVDNMVVGNISQSNKKVNE